MRADILVQYVGAYIFSLFVAHLVIRQILRWIRKQTYQDDKAKPLDFYLGITERAVATSLVVWAPSYVGAFIGAWVAAKLAANWNWRGNTEAARQGTLTALIGNVISFAFAVGAGVFLNSDALSVWYNGSNHP